MASVFQASKLLDGDFLVDFFVPQHFFGLPLRLCCIPTETSSQYFFSTDNLIMVILFRDFVVNCGLLLLDRMNICMNGMDRNAYLHSFVNWNALENSRLDASNRKNFMREHVIKIRFHLADRSALKTN